MQVNPDNSPKSEYLPDQIHSDQVPTWPIVQNLSEYLMPNPGVYGGLPYILRARVLVFDNGYTKVIPLICLAGTCQIIVIL